MCYYDSIVFSCGDWKWGHFRQHCQKEYRVGEVCGMKLIYNTINDSSKCSICQSMDKKYRRYARAKSDYDRHRGDPRRQASVAKAAQDCHEISGEIEKLNAARQFRYDGRPPPDGLYVGHGRGFPNNSFGAIHKNLENMGWSRQHDSDISPILDPAASYVYDMNGSLEGAVMPVSSDYKLWNTESPPIASFGIRGATGVFQEHEQLQMHVSNLSANPEVEVSEQGLESTFNSLRIQDESMVGEAACHIPYGNDPSSSVTDEGYCSMKRSEKPTPDASHDSDDTASITTDGISSRLEKDAKIRLEAMLASELLNDLTLGSKEIEEELCNSLSLVSETLKHFSILIGNRASSNLEQRATTFVRHSRNRICSQLKEQIQSSFARDMLPEGRCMTTKEKFDLWRVDPCDPEEATPSSVIDGADNEDDMDLPEDIDLSQIPDAQEAKIFLLESEEYKWLLEKIQNSLATSSNSTLLNIRQRFMQIFSNRGRHPSTSGLSLHVTLAWSPLQLVPDQLAPTDGLSFLESTITFSGHAVDAHATTCADYVKFMWPRFGPRIVKSLWAAAMSGNETESVKEPQLSVKLECNKIATVVRASGCSTALLEVLEVTTWLGAACRNAPRADRIYYCAPRIPENCREGVSFTVLYDFSAVEVDSQIASSATCWHQMVKNPVIAKDFPVPRRQHGERGLEVSLEMMAILAQTFWATCFNGFLLKGFNSITAPVGRIGNSILWHFQVNKDGTRMSYENARQHYDFSSYGDAIFAGARHFVGWTANAESIAGTSSANYAGMEESDSTPTSYGLCLESMFSIQGGYFINVGCKIRRGSKDAPEFLRWNLYERQMDTTTRWGVILADTTERRHWLIDGATAILHLIRAWLSSEHVRYAPKDKASKIWSSNLQSCPDASYETLVHRENRKLELMELETADSWWRFENLAQQYYHVLEQIHDRVKWRNPTETDIRIKTRALVGFDIIDLLLEDGPVQPRTRKLQVGAEDWLDLSLKLKTINILGSNLGELIRPVSKTTQTHKPCANQDSIPTGQDLLAVSLSTLKSIIGRHRGHTDSMVHLADGAYLHNPESHFTMCECNSTPSGRCAAVVTKLSNGTARSEDLKPTHDIFSRYCNGALVFGHRPATLLKANTHKRKVEASKDAETGAERQPSDSGIDVGSSGISGSPVSSASTDTSTDGGTDAGSMSTEWSFLGAAKRMCTRKS